MDILIARVIFYSLVFSLILFFRFFLFFFFLTLILYVRIEEYTEYVE